MQKTGKQASQNEQAAAKHLPLLASFPVAALITDLDGEILYANQRAQEQFGLHIGRNITRYFENSQEYKQTLEKIDQVGFLDDFELSAHASDGTPLWLLISSRSFEFDGQPAFLSSVVDITERKQAEKSLVLSQLDHKKTEKNYQNLFDALPDIVMRFDPNFRHLYASENVKQVIGLPASAFIGKTHQELGFPADKCKLWEEAIQTVFATRAPQALEFSFKGIEGEDVYEWRLVPEFNLRGEVETVFSISRNMTSQRLAEKNYTRLFRQMLDGFALHEIILDGQGQPIDYRFLAVNPAFERLTGLQAENLIGKRVLEVMPETEKYWIEVYGKVVATGEPVTFENYSAALHKYFFVSAFRYAPGQFSVIFTDITERKIAEEKLARQSARIRALYRVQQAIISSLELADVLNLLAREIVEQLQVDAVSVLLFNPHTQTLDFAARQGFDTNALKFTNLPLGQGLAGQAALSRKIVHSTDFAAIPTLAKTIEHEKFVIYYGLPLIANDTLHGVIEIFHRSPLSPDPDWLTFLETLADQAAISIDNAHLLQRTRQNLKEANALYRINQDLISSVDPYHLMKNVVELLKDSFGYYHVQIFVAESSTGDFVVRAASGEIGQKIQEQGGYRLSAGEGIVGFTAETDKPFFTNDVDSSISFVRSPFLPETKSQLAVPIKIGREFLGLIDVQQDATAILTEHDLQLVSSVADQLAVALQKAALYADLQDALFQEKAMRSQLVHNEKLSVSGRLLASVSHEMNNPIQAIQNALFLLKEERGISYQGRQDLEIVLSETERMATLLERLRTTYQPASREDFKLVQLNAIIEDVCALICTHLRHNQISFEFDADPALPMIRGLEDQLKQVVLNLFLNAVDAMPGGGHIKITTEYQLESNEVLLIVSDSGPGIEESIFSNIFDAFVTNKERGTGLGLTISHEIIQKHRGRVLAENNPEKGATFRIWLPADMG